MKTLKEQLYDKDGIRAYCVSHDALNIPSNMLTIKFDEERLCASGLSGIKRIKSLANCHSPKELWAKLHDTHYDWHDYVAQCIELDGLKEEDSASLLTGVNMEQLAFAEEECGDLHVCVWATAGVNTNAIAAGKDNMEPCQDDALQHGAGTINIIVIYNQNLTEASLISAFITVTEAKTSALMDMDVKSVYTPSLSATGTGTDQIITVSGPNIEEAVTHYGGHTLMGHLTAKAVYRAVKESLTKSFAKWGKRF